MSLTLVFCIFYTHLIFYVSFIYIRNIYIYNLIKYWHVDIQTITLRLEMFIYYNLFPVRRIQRYDTNRKNIVADETSRYVPCHV